MKTQENRILQLLKDNPEGLHPTTIVTETGILQYNARINGLRSRFDCSHKNNNTICFASEHIINKKLKNGTTIFMYTQTKKPWDYPVEEQKKRQEERDKQFNDVLDKAVQTGLF